MRARGFSLLEVLVASAVFAVVAGLAWGGLETVARQRRVLDEETRQWQQLQRTVGRVERDLRQALPVAVPGADGDPRPALVGDADGLSLRSTSAAGLRTVTWACHDGALWRVTDDTAADAPPLLTGLTACAWSYRDDGATSAAAWQPPSPESLPRAIELQLASARFGEIRRQVALPSTPGAVR